MVLIYCKRKINNKKIKRLVLNLKGKNKCTVHYKHLPLYLSLNIELRKFQLLSETIQGDYRP